MAFFEALAENHSFVQWYRAGQVTFVRIPSYPAALYSICDAYPENKASLIGRLAVPNLGIYELNEADMARLSKIVRLESLITGGNKPWWHNLIPRRTESERYNPVHYKLGVELRVFQLLIRPVLAVWVLMHPNLRELHHRERRLRASQTKWKKSTLKG